MTNFLLASLFALALVPAASAGGGTFPNTELAQAASATSYSVPRIVVPKNADTIHDNSGAVPVEVALQPALNVKAGHRLRVVLDDTVQPGAYTATRFTLQQVDRGTHSLRVVVTDEAGKELARSEPIEFYMWQASRLFRQRSPQ